MSFDFCPSCAAKEFRIKPGTHKSLFLTPRIQLGDHSERITRAVRDDSAVNEPPILLLPPEILNEVLSKAIADDNWENGVYKISIVCRAFHRYAQSLLFCDISLRGQSGHSLVVGCERVRNLYSLIEADPSLSQCCKSLTFKLPFVNTQSEKRPVIPTLADYVLGIKLLKTLSKLRKVEVYGGFEHQLTWQFLRDSFLSMRSLESLKIECRPFRPQEANLFLSDAWSCIQALQLKLLELYGVRTQKDGSSLNVSKYLVRSSSIVDISLGDFEETPGSLETFLRTPQVLQHFSFHPSKTSRESKVWSLKTIQALLHDHITSLISLSVGTLCNRGSPSNFNTFSVRSFSQLEKLTISRWDMDLDITPELACAALLAPNLRHFVWDFTHSWEESWDAFGRKQRDWILSFAQFAIANKSALRKIEIIFTPPSERECAQAIYEQMEDFWPWDLMDEVRDAVQPHIEVVYNDHLTKEQCEQLISSYPREMYEYSDYEGESE